MVWLRLDFDLPQFRYCSPKLVEAVQQAGQAVTISSRSHPISIDSK
jgi:hypothetical protein